jgi:hypothetical protein
MEATTVAAAGLAETQYTIANFALSLSAKGTSVPTAKSRLKVQIEALNTALAKMKADLNLEFVKNSVRTHSNVQENWVYNRSKGENELQGHIVNYSLSFQIDDLEKVNEVFDVLTSLDEVRVNNPTFGLKPAQRERLSKKALKNAFAKAHDRFVTECEVLGLNHNDFEICSWEATYHDSQRGENVGRRVSARAYSNSLEGGAIAAAASAAPSDEIDLVSGLAEVNVNLEVGYARKSNKVLSEV